MYHNMPVFQGGWSEPIQSTNWVNQAQNQHFSNTYNPGWINHPNFSWRDDQPGWFPPPPQHQYLPYQNPQSYPYVAHPGFQPHVPAQPPHNETLEETLQAFMQGQAQTMQAITELRSSISDLNSALHTLVLSTPKDATETEEAEKEPEVARLEQKKPVSADAETSKGYQPVVPYPQRLAAGKSGVVKLTFGNAALKLNVFNTCKMPASGLNAGESLTPKFICSNSPFYHNEDDFNFFDCFADTSLPLQGTERMPSKCSTQNKRRFLSELRKQFKNFCKSRWSGLYIVDPREVS
ncbi:hypothetical protein I3760_06G073400 [Carya illinoinensis]|nr:hypothetical protein I3760_12G018400 [Carya illinoinensis]KAG2693883.1 hypothetical protein I3760_08G116300 [Carya illinoinensis]KAG2702061.1 hypothetical protein I3760_06G073400 [Carya illinoinensis]